MSAMDDLVSILKSREPLYAKADVTLVTTGKSPEQSLAELMGLMGNGSPAALGELAPAPA